MFAALQASTDFIKKETALFRPEIGIILGTGLAALANEIKVTYEFPYELIPGFSRSTVEGHPGKLILGYLGKKTVIALQGRFHYYEGYTMQQVVFPVHVMKALGIKYLFVSNASGGLNPDFEPGDLMLITDHINFFPANPLTGNDAGGHGTRFPDMSDAYDKSLIEKAKELAKKNNINLHTGTYIGVQGPSLETPAEYRCFRIMGADAVGMSTVPEIIAARYLHLSCFAVSVIANMGIPEKLKKTSHEQVQQMAAAAEPKMTHLFKLMAETL